MFSEQTAYTPKTLYSKNMLQTIHTKAGSAARKPISKHDYYLKPYFDGEFSNAHSSKLAQHIERYIKITKKYRRETQFFVEAILNRIYFLHKYNLKVAEVTFKYPLTQNLKQLLLRYVVLECSILYKKEYYTPCYQARVEERILKLLRNVYSSYLESLNSVPTEKLVNESCTAILNLLIKVKTEFEVQNDLLENIAKKLLHKMGRLEQVNALKNRSIPCPLDSYLSDPALVNSYKNIITSDYGTDDDLRIQEDSIQVYDPIENAGSHNDHDGIKQEIDDFLRVSNRLHQSLTTSSTIKKVPTIYIDDDDEEMLVLEEEIRTSCKSARRQMEQENKKSMLKEKQCEVFFNHKPLELDDVKPDFKREVIDHVLEGESSTNQNINYKNHVNTVKSSLALNEVIIIDDDDDDDDVNTTKLSSTESNIPKTQAENLSGEEILELISDEEESFKVISSAEEEELLKVNNSDILDKTLKTIEISETNSDTVINESEKSVHKTDSDTSTKNTGKIHSDVTEDSVDVGLKNSYQDTNISGNKSNEGDYFPCLPSKNSITSTNRATNNFEIETNLSNIFKEAKAGRNQTLDVIEQSVRITIQTLLDHVDTKSYKTDSSQNKVQTNYSEANLGEDTKEMCNKVNTNTQEFIDEEVITNTKIHMVNRKVENVEGENENQTFTSADNTTEIVQYSECSKNDGVVHGSAINGSTALHSEDFRNTSGIISSYLSNESTIIMCKETDNHYNGKYSMNEANKLEISSASLSDKKPFEESIEDKTAACNDLNQLISSSSGGEAGNKVQDLISEEIEKPIRSVTKSPEAENVDTDHLQETLEVLPDENESFNSFNARPLENEEVLDEDEKRNPINGLLKPLNISRITCDIAINESEEHIRDRGVSSHIVSLLNVKNQENTDAHSYDKRNIEKEAAADKTEIENFIENNEKIPESQSINPEVQDIKNIENDLLRILHGNGNSPDKFCETNKAVDSVMRIEDINIHDAKEDTEVNENGLRCDMDSSERKLEDQFTEKGSSSETLEIDSGNIKVNSHDLDPENNSEKEMGTDSNKCYLDISELDMNTVNGRGEQSENIEIISDENHDNEDNLASRLPSEQTLTCTNTVENLEIKALKNVHEKGETVFKAMENSLSEENTDLEISKQCEENATPKTIETGDTIEQSVKIILQTMLDDIDKNNCEKDLCQNVQKNKELLETKSLPYLSKESAIMCKETDKQCGDELENKHKNDKLEASSDTKLIKKHIEKNKEEVASFNSINQLNADCEAFSEAESAIPKDNRTTQNEKQAMEEQNNEESLDNINYEHSDIQKELVSVQPLEETVEKYIQVQSTNNIISNESSIDVSSTELTNNDLLTENPLHETENKKSTSSCIGENAVKAAKEEQAEDTIKKCSSNPEDGIATKLPIEVSNDESEKLNNDQLVMENFFETDSVAVEREEVHVKLSQDIEKNVATEEEFLPSDVVSNEEDIHVQKLIHFKNAEANEVEVNTDNAECFKLSEQKDDKNDNMYTAEDIISNVEVTIETYGIESEIKENVCEDYTFEDINTGHFEEVVETTYQTNTGEMHYEKYLHDDSESKLISDLNIQKEEIITEIDTLELTVSEELIINENDSQSYGQNGDKNDSDRNENDQDVALDTADALRRKINSLEKMGTEVIVTNDQLISEQVVQNLGMCPNEKTSLDVLAIVASEVSRQDSLFTKKKKKNVNNEKKKSNNLKYKVKTAQKKNLSKAKTKSKRKSNKEGNVEIKRVTRSTRIKKKVEAKHEVKCKPHDFVIINNSGIPPPANKIYTKKLAEIPLTSEDSNDSEGNLFIAEDDTVKSAKPLKEPAGYSDEFKSVNKKLTYYDEDIVEKGIVFSCESKVKGTVLISIPDTGQQNFDILTQIEELDKYSADKEGIDRQNTEDDVSSGDSKEIGADFSGVLSSSDKSTETKYCNKKIDACNIPDMLQYLEHPVCEKKTFRTKAEQKDYDKFSLKPYVSIERLNICSKKQRGNKQVRSKSFDVDLIRNANDNQPLNSKSTELPPSPNLESRPEMLKLEDESASLRKKCDDLPIEAKLKTNTENKSYNMNERDDSDDDIPLLQRTKLGFTCTKSSIIKPKCLSESKKEKLDHRIDMVKDAEKKDIVKAKSTSNKSKIRAKGNKKDAVNLLRKKITKKVNVAEKVTTALSDTPTLSVTSPSILVDSPVPCFKESVPSTNVENMSSNTLEIETKDTFIDDNEHISQKMNYEVPTYEEYMKSSNTKYYRTPKLRRKSVSKHNLNRSERSPENTNRKYYTPPKLRRKSVVDNENVLKGTQSPKESTSKQIKLPTSKVEILSNCKNTVTPTTERLKRKLETDFKFKRTDLSVDNSHIQQQKIEGEIHVTSENTSSASILLSKNRDKEEICNVNGINTDLSISDLTGQNLCKEVVKKEQFKKSNTTDRQTNVESEDKKNESSVLVRKNESEELCAIAESHLTSSVTSSLNRTENVQVHENPPAETFVVKDKLITNVASEVSHKVDNLLVQGLKSTIDSIVDYKYDNLIENDEKSLDNLPLSERTVVSQKHGPKPKSAEKQIKPPRKKSHTINSVRNIETASKQQKRETSQPENSNKSKYISPNKFTIEADNIAHNKEYKTKKARKTKTKLVEDIRADNENTEILTSIKDIYSEKITKINTPKERNTLKDGKQNKCKRSKSVSDILNCIAQNKFLEENEVDTNNIDKMGHNTKKARKCTAKSEKRKTKIVPDATKVLKPDTSLKNDRISTKKKKSKESIAKDNKQQKFGNTSKPEYMSQNKIEEIVAVNEACKAEDKPKKTRKSKIKSIEKVTENIQKENETLNANRNTGKGSNKKLNKLTKPKEKNIIEDGKQQKSGKLKTENKTLSKSIPKTGPIEAVLTVKDCGNDKIENNIKKPGKSKAKQTEDIMEEMLTATEILKQDTKTGIDSDTNLNKMVKSKERTTASEKRHKHGKLYKPENDKQQKHDDKLSKPENEYVSSSLSQNSIVTENSMEALDRYVKVENNTKKIRERKVKPAEEVTVDPKNDTEILEQNKKAKNVPEDYQQTRDNAEPEDVLSPNKSEVADNFENIKVETKNKINKSRAKAIENSIQYNSNEIAVIKKSTNNGKNNTKLNKLTKTKKKTVIGHTFKSKNNYKFDSTKKSLTKKSGKFFKQLKEENGLHRNISKEKKEDNKTNEILDPSHHQKQTESKETLMESVCMSMQDKPKDKRSSKTQKGVCSPQLKFENAKTEDSDDKLQKQITFDRLESIPCRLSLNSVSLLATDNTNNNSRKKKDFVRNSKKSSVTLKTKVHKTSVTNKYIETTSVKDLILEKCNSCIEPVNSLNIQSCTQRNIIHDAIDADETNKNIGFSKKSEENLKSGLNESLAETSFKTTEKIKQGDINYSKVEVEMNNSKDISIEKTDSSHLDTIEENINNDIQSTEGPPTKSIFTEEVINDYETDTNKSNIHGSAIVADKTNKNIGFSKKSEENLKSGLHESLAETSFKTTEKIQQEDINYSKVEVEMNNSEDICIEKTDTSHLDTIEKNDRQPTEGPPTKSIFTKEVINDYEIDTNKSNIQGSAIVADKTNKNIGFSKKSGENLKSGLHKSLAETSFKTTEKIKQKDINYSKVEVEMNNSEDICIEKTDTSHLNTIEKNINNDIQPTERPPTKSIFTNEVINDYEIDTNKSNIQRSAIVADKSNKNIGFSNKSGENLKSGLNESLAKTSFKTTEKIKQEDINYSKVEVEMNNSEDICIEKTDTSHLDTIEKNDIQPTEGPPTKSVFTKEVINDYEIDTNKSNIQGSEIDADETNKNIEFSNKSGENLKSGLNESLAETSFKTTEKIKQGDINYSKVEAEMHNTEDISIEKTDTSHLDTIEKNINNDMQPTEGPPTKSVFTKEVINDYEIDTNKSNIQGSEIDADETNKNIEFSKKSEENLKSRLNESLAETSFKTTEKIKQEDINYSKVEAEMHNSEDICIEKTNTSHLDTIEENINNDIQPTEGPPTKSVFTKEVINDYEIDTNKSNIQRSAIVADKSNKNIGFSKKSEENLKSGLHESLAETSFKTTEKIQQEDINYSKVEVEMNNSEDISIEKTDTSHLDTIEENINNDIQPTERPPTKSVFTKEVINDYEIDTNKSNIQGSAIDADETNKNIGFSKKSEENLKSGLNESLAETSFKTTEKIKQGDINYSKVEAEMHNTEDISIEETDTSHLDTIEKNINNDMQPTEGPPTKSIFTKEVINDYEIDPDTSHIQMDKNEVEKTEVPLLDQELDTSTIENNKEINNTASLETNELMEGDFQKIDHEITIPLEDSFPQIENSDHDTTSKLENETKDDDISSKHERIDEESPHIPREERFQNPAHISEQQNQQEGMTEETLDISKRETKNADDSFNKSNEVNGLSSNQESVKISDQPIENIKKNNSEFTVAVSKIPEEALSSKIEECENKDVKEDDTELQNSHKNLDNDKLQEDDKICTNLGIAKGIMDTNFKSLDVLKDNFHPESIATVSPTCTTSLDLSRRKRKSTNLKGKTICNEKKLKFSEINIDVSSECFNNKPPLSVSPRKKDKKSIECIISQLKGEKQNSTESHEKIQQSQSTSSFSVNVDVAKLKKKLLQKIKGNNSVPTVKDLPNTEQEANIVLVGDDNRKSEESILKSEILHIKVDTFSDMTSDESTNRKQDNTNNFVPRVKDLPNTEQKASTILVMDNCRKSEESIPEFSDTINSDESTIRKQEGGDNKENVSKDKAVPQRNSAVTSLTTHEIGNTNKEVEIVSTTLDSIQVHEPEVKNMDGSLSELKEIDPVPIENLNDNTSSNLLPSGNEANLSIDVIQNNLTVSSFTVNKVECNTDMNVESVPTPVHIQAQELEIKNTDSCVSSLSELKEIGFVPIEKNVKHAGFAEFDTLSKPVPSVIENLLIDGDGIQNSSTISSPTVNDVKCNKEMEIEIASAAMIIIEAQEPEIKITDECVDSLSDLKKIIPVPIENDVLVESNTLFKPMCSLNTNDIINDTTNPSVCGGTIDTVIPTPELKEIVNTEIRDNYDDLLLKDKFVDTAEMKNSSNNLSTDIDMEEPTLLSHEIETTTEIGEGAFFYNNENIKENLEAMNPCALMDSKTIPELEPIHENISEPVPIPSSDETKFTENPVMATNSNNSILLLPTSVPDITKSVAEENSADPVKLPKESFSNTCFEISSKKIITDPVSTHVENFDSTNVNGTNLLNLNDLVPDVDTAANVSHAQENVSSEGVCMLSEIISTTISSTVNKLPCVSSSATIKLFPFPVSTQADIKSRCIPMTEVDTSKIIPDESPMPTEKLLSDKNEGCMFSLSGQIDSNPRTLTSQSISLNLQDVPYTKIPMDSTQTFDLISPNSMIQTSTGSNFMNEIPVDDITEIRCSNNIDHNYTMESLGGPLLSGRPEEENIFSTSTFNKHLVDSPGEFPLNDNQLPSELSESDDTYKLNLDNEYAVKNLVMLGGQTSSDVNSFPLSNLNMSDIEIMNLIEDSISNSEENSNSLDTACLSNSLEHESKDLPSASSSWALYITNTNQNHEVIVPLSDECLAPPFSVTQDGPVQSTTLTTLVKRNESEKVTSTLTTPLENSLKDIRNIANPWAHFIANENLNKKVVVLSNEQYLTPQFSVSQNDFVKSRTPAASNFDIDNSLTSNTKINDEMSLLEMIQSEIKRSKRQKKMAQKNSVNNNDFLPKRTYSRTVLKAPPKKKIIASPIEANKGKILQAKKHGEHSETSLQHKSSPPQMLLNETSVRDGASIKNTKILETELKQSSKDVPSSSPSKLRPEADLSQHENGHKLPIELPSQVPGPSRDLVDRKVTVKEQGKLKPSSPLFNLNDKVQVHSEAKNLFEILAELPSNKTVDNSVKTCDDISSKVSDVHCNIAELVKSRKRAAANKYCNYNSPPPAKELKLESSKSKKATDKLSSSRPKTATPEAKPNIEYLQPILKRSQRGQKSPSNLSEKPLKVDTPRSLRDEENKGWDMETKSQVKQGHFVEKLPNPSISAHNKLNLQSGGIVSMPDLRQSSSSKYNYSIESILSKEPRSHSVQLNENLLKDHGSSKHRGTKRTPPTPVDDETQRKQIKTGVSEPRKWESSSDSAFDDLLQQGNVNELIRLRVTEDNKLKTERKNSPLLKSISKQAVTNDKLKLDIINPQKLYCSKRQEQVDEVSKLGIDRRNNLTKPYSKNDSSESDVLRSDRRSPSVKLDGRVKEQADYIKFMKSSCHPAYNRPREGSTSRSKFRDEFRPEYFKYYGAYNYHRDQKVRERSYTDYKRRREGYLCEQVRGREGHPHHPRLREPSGSSSRFSNFGQSTSGRSSNVSGAYYRNYPGHTSHTPENAAALNGGPYTKRGTILSEEKQNELLNELRDTVHEQIKCSGFNKSSSKPDYSWIEKINPLPFIEKPLFPPKSPSPPNDPK